MHYALSLRTPRPAVNLCREYLHSGPAINLGRVPDNSMPRASLSKDEPFKAPSDHPAMRSLKADRNSVLGVATHLSADSAYDSSCQRPESLLACPPTPSPIPPMGATDRALAARETTYRLYRPGVGIS